MINYRYFKAIPSNFNYEEVLANNHFYKTENKNLKTLLFALGIFVLGANIYIVIEEFNKKTRSN